MTAKLTFKTLIGRVPGMAACLAALLFLGLPHAAAGPVALRAHVVVEKGLVTLGDLFDNLEGDTAGVAVFRSPDPGQSGVVSTGRIAAAARDHGVHWGNTGLHAEVTVTRSSTMVPLETVLSVIEETVRQRLGAAQDASIAVSLAPGSKALHLESGASGAIRVARFEFNEHTGSFTAQITPIDGQAAAATYSFQGEATQTVKLPMLTRTIARGEEITARDVTMTSMARQRVQAGVLTDAGSVIGLAARRSLSSGQFLRTEDLEEPRIVRRNRPVTIVYQNSGLMLSTRGRAMADGAKGEIVTVMNLRSKRMIETIVIAPDKVAVVGAEPAAVIAGLAARSTARAE